MTGAADPDACGRVSDRPGFARHAEALAALGARGRRRALAPRSGHDFSSNDYLGLAGSQALRDAAHDALARGVAIGSGGSRLLRGNDPEHEALEREAAGFFDAPAALLTGSGFVGNVAIFSTLPMQGDLVLHDALVHASAHEGMRLGRATCRSFAHNDAGAARDALRAWRAEGGAGRVWIACESVYSMEGDLAPLADLAAVAAEDGAVLVVDEAHATGRARGFVFATAPQPLGAALIRASLRIVAEGAALRAAAWDTIAAAHRTAEAAGFGRFDTQILPVQIGEDAAAVALAQALQARGHDVRAIRPPTVPRGTARLRISVTPNVDAAALDALFSDLSELRHGIAA